MYANANIRGEAARRSPRRELSARLRKTAILAIFVDFDKKAQKLNQNKAGIGIAHQFYIENDISGVIPEIFFIY